MVVPRALVAAWPDRDILGFCDEHIRWPVGPAEQPGPTQIDGNPLLYVSTAGRRRAPDGVNGARPAGEKHGWTMAGPAVSLSPLSAGGRPVRTPTIRLSLAAGL